MDDSSQSTSRPSLSIPEAQENPNIRAALENFLLLNQRTVTDPQQIVPIVIDAEPSDSRGYWNNEQAMRMSMSRVDGPSVPVVQMFDDHLSTTGVPSNGSRDGRNNVSTFEPWSISEDSYDDISQGSVTSEHYRNPDHELPFMLNEESSSSDIANSEARTPDTFNEESRNSDIVNAELRAPDAVDEEPSNFDIVTAEPVTPNTVSEESRNTHVVKQKTSGAGYVAEEEPSAKVRKLNTSIQEEGETCPICLDMWANSGAHRLVSLKCGHLFGAQCVERWLKAQSARERNCPTCKSHASLKDIRFIYAKKLVAADTTLITGLQKQIDILQAEKVRSELELEKSRIAHRACMLQLEDLRKTLLKNQVREQPQRRSWRFALEKNLEINNHGGCRVLTYNCRTYDLYVTQKSTNFLFPGFGIRKVSCVDYKLGQFLLLHPKPIRDITYSQPRDLLLSVGLDNTARIVERGILSHTVQCGMPLWSCSWDYLRSNEFYVGGVGGVIQQYDVRNSGTHIQKLNITGDLSPVVSLVSTEHGLLSCQLNSCWLWMHSMRQWERKSLPVDGPFMSLCYDNESHKVLVSCRASGNERSRLILYKLKSANNSVSGSSSDVVIDYEQTFPGSVQTSLMCKSAFVTAPGARWIAAHSESDSSLYLHGLEGSRTMCLPASEPALDVCAARVDSDTVVAALSDSRLRLYRAVPTS